MLPSTGKNGGQRNVTDPINLGEHKVFLLIFSFLYTGIFVRHALFSLNLEVMLSLDMAVYVIFPLLIAGTCYATARDRFIETIAEFKSTWKGVLLFALLGIVYANLSIFCVSWAEYFINYYVVRYTDISQLIIAKFSLYGVLYLSISAAIFEEWLYKSVLIRCFRGYPKEFVFVTTSSLLFVISHYWQGSISMFFMALLFALPTAVYYYRTRNILNLFVFHFVADFLIFGAGWAKL